MELIQLESPQYHLPKLRYDFYNLGHQHEPLWYNYWLKRFVVIKRSWIYGLWMIMLIDVIGWFLKMIEVYGE